MNEHDSTTIPADLVGEVGVLAEKRYPAGVACRQAESDLPGFDYYELFGTVTSCHGECGLDADHDIPAEVRIGGRLVLTLLATGCQVELDAEETADVMWALANATRRNRRASRRRDVGMDHDETRAARFERQRALMAKIADSPA